MFMFLQEKSGENNIPLHDHFRPNHIRGHTIQHTTVPTSGKTRFGIKCGTLPSYTRGKRKRENEETINNECKVVRQTLTGNPPNPSQRDNPPPRVIVTSKQIDNHFYYQDNPQLFYCFSLPPLSFYCLGGGVKMQRRTLKGQHKMHRQHKKPRHS